MSTADRLGPGDVLDGFVLGDPVAGGTMARIFRARREGCELPMVVKVPRLGLGETGASVVSHEVERLVLASLSGRHVPRFVAAGDLDRVPYIAMEYIEGEALEVIAQRAPIAPAEVAALGAAIAKAVHALHQQEAIHLDLKPGNILLRPGREAVLLDFGLSHHARFPDLLAEEFRRPIGTAPYISPEQVLGVRTEPRSDLFALGVILYHLATGRLPYGAPGSPRGLRERLWSEPDAPRSIVAAIPEWLQEVILRCLEPDAGRRPASAARMAFDLENPATVEVTERGRRVSPTGWRARVGRWIRAAGYEPAPPARPSVQAQSAPILLLAIGSVDSSGPRADAAASRALQALAAHPEARLVCATVIRRVPEWGTSDPEETAAREHLRHRVALQQWAAAHGLPVGRVTFHVLEGNDVAAELLAYIHANPVDQVLVGEPPVRDAGLGIGHGWAASVSGRLAAQARCTVTVVRVRGDD